MSPIQFSSRSILHRVIHIERPVSASVRLLQGPKLAAVEQLRERKRKAVEVEDYELLIQNWRGNRWKQDETAKRYTELSRNADHLWISSSFQMLLLSTRRKPVLDSLL